VACQQQIFTSHGSAGWTSRTKALVDPGAGEDLLLGHSWCLPAVSFGRGWERSGSLMRTLIPSWGLHPHDLIFSQSAPSPPRSPVSFPRMNFQGGCKHSVYSSWEIFGHKYKKYHGK